MFYVDDVIDKPQDKAFELHEHFTPGTDVSFVLGDREEGKLRAQKVFQFKTSYLAHFDKNRFENCSLMKSKKQKRQSILSKRKETISLFPF